MYLCEGEKAWLQCQQFELLRMKRVYWGRDNDKMCPKIPPGLSGDNCDVKSSLRTSSLTTTHVKTHTNS